jgi:predicted nucleic acid-binding protein
LRTLIVDPSVAARWFLPPEREQLVDNALRILNAFTAGEINLIVPDLFWIELTNVFRVAVQRTRWTAEHAQSALGMALELDIRTVESRQLLPNVLVNANQYGCSAYDAVYTALANQVNSDLVTADEKLVQLVAGYFPVRWLGAF